MKKSLWVILIGLFLIIQSFTMISAIDSSISCIDISAEENNYTIIKKCNFDICTQERRDHYPELNNTECLLQYAIDTDNPNICALHSLILDECFTYFGFEELSDCEDVLNDKSCLKYLINNKNSLEFCETLNSTSVSEFILSKRDLCVSLVAKNNNDTDICALIKETEYSSCITSIARMNKNLDQCSLLSEDNIGRCVESVKKERGLLEDCSEIDTFHRSRCYKENFEKGMGFNLVYCVAHPGVTQYSEFSSCFSALNIPTKIFAYGIYALSLLYSTFLFRKSFKKEPCRKNNLLISFSFSSLLALFFIPILFGKILAQPGLALILAPYTSWPLMYLGVLVYFLSATVLQGGILFFLLTGVPRIKKKPLTRKRAFIIHLVLNLVLCFITYMILLSGFN